MSIMISDVLYLFIDGAMIYFENNVKAKKTFMSQHIKVLGILEPPLKSA